MNKHFAIQQNHEWIEIFKVTSCPFYHYMFEIDGLNTGPFYTGDVFYLPKKWLSPGRHRLIIRAYTMMTRGPVPVEEQISFEVPHWDKSDPVLERRFGNPDVLSPSQPESVPDNIHETQDRDFRAGDILIASDNIGYIPKGYMGHSAIVISDQKLIESPGGHPSIRKDTIRQFLENHPVHAQYRPKSSEIGEMAAQYARHYLKKYKEKLKNGEQKPTFSFSLDGSLEDGWTHIYCSKLVWLCYANGANYKFKNDFLWFSPEDLEKNLKENGDFELVYKNPDYGFKLNT